MPETANLSQPRLESRERRGETITLSEQDIATVERMLQLIDIKNGVLACISNWFAVWGLAQEICLDFEELPAEVRNPFAPRFYEVLGKMRDQGKNLAGLAVVDVLAISGTHFKLATGHYLDDLGACVAFLDDRLMQWFGAVETDACSHLWSENHHGANDLVSKSE